MADIAELKKMPVFADLPDDQLSWFLSQAPEAALQPGETYVRQNDPAVNMFVILDGQLEGRGEFNGETYILSFKSGDVTGVLPGVTKAPTCSWACPAMPSIGATSRVNSRLIFAVSTAAS